MRLKSLVTLLILVLVALLIWWFQLDADRTANLLATDDEKFIDAYMRDFKLTAMNAAGKTDYILSGHEFNHYNDSDIATLQQPVLHFLQAEYHWRLSAERGEINDDHNQIVLFDNVVIQQLPIQEDGPAGLRMLTERLDIDTGRQLASTSLPVEIIYRQLTLKSQGMRLNNRNAQLELLSDVAGVYDKP
jgi:LPS export ABC transporter protein LptC